MAEWIQTYSGRCFAPTEPVVESINIIDIIHAMSMLVRFGGHQRVPYSVGQHSLRVAEEVARLCSEQGFPLRRSLYLTLGALVHDGSEGMGMIDIPRPIKRLPELGGYVELEDKVQNFIIDQKMRIELSDEDHQIIKHADLRALATETRDNLNTCDQKWSLRSEPYPEKTVPMSYGQVKKRLFLMYSRIIHQLDAVEVGDGFSRRNDLLQDVNKFLETLTMKDGTLWKHYRKKSIYRCHGVFLDKETLMPMVSYSHEEQHWTQEAFLWDEFVSEDGLLVPRYSLVE